MNSSPDPTRPGNLAFQTNTSIVHTSLGEVQPIDKAFKEKQKLKLTKANFLIGKSPQTYGTTNKSAFYP